MTSLVSWISVDSRAPSALYLAADSRFSWPSGEKWDFGRKVFASRSRPEVFAFVGQVAFPSIVLGQLADAPPGDDLSSCAQERFDRLRELLRNARSSHPVPGSFGVAYGVREGDGVGARFRLFWVRWEEGAGWSHDEEESPSESDTVIVWGSGKKSVEDWKKRWLESMGKVRTSRAVFSAFCDSVESPDDPGSGGAPQLATLERTGSGRHLGFVGDGGAHFLGLPFLGDDDGVDRWRNRLFERCSIDGTRLSNAQPHHRPRELSTLER